MRFKVAKRDGRWVVSRMLGGLGCEDGRFPSLRAAILAIELALELRDA